MDFKIPEAWMDWMLFIDDERYPIDPEFVIARTSHDAIMMILNWGMPTHIAFDHDLGVNSKGVIQDSMELVNFLWHRCENNELIFKKNFTFSVHSQNVEGAKNIRSKMTQLLEHYRGEQ